MPAKTTAQLQVEQTYKGLISCPSFPIVLLYPLESRSGTITALSVHITLVKEKLILNYRPHNCLFFTLSVRKIQTIAS